MTLVITTGPAWEPIDGMRRMTNASTGRLGSDLADVLTAAGHRVLLFRGQGSTAPPSQKAAEVRAFGTNDDLARGLEALVREEPVHAVLHAAALCDFRVARVLDSAGVEKSEAKISSRSGRVLLELEPATKVLPRLREWFPKALIAGWKYELNGAREDALAAARRQIEEARTDVCVVNGAAWGQGFGWCTASEDAGPLPDAAALAERFVTWFSATS